MMKNLLLLFVIICITESCQQKSNAKIDSLQEFSSLESSLNVFLDSWHTDAAEGRIAYFDKMAPEGIYLGTDATELWTTSEFKEWSAPYFEDGQAWDFQAISRNIYTNKDQQVVWFDELLNTWMGVCRGSGVLTREKGDWKIAHYHLSLAIPNEAIKPIIQLIEAKDSLDSQP